MGGRLSTGPRVGGWTRRVGDREDWMYHLRKARAQQGL